MIEFRCSYQTKLAIYNMILQSYSCKFLAATRILISIGSLDAETIARAEFRHKIGLIIVVTFMPWSYINWLLILSLIIYFSFMSSFTHFSLAFLYLINKHHFIFYYS